MGRKRVVNAELPERLFLSHGSYYYVCLVDGKDFWHPLGKDKEHAVSTAKSLNTLKRKERLAVVGSLRSASELVKQAIFSRDGFSCVYCGATNDLGIDHVIPYASGGSSLPFNLVACCGSCNESKNDKNPAQFIAELLGMREAITAEVMKILARS